MSLIPECEKGKHFADNEGKDTKDNKAAGQDLTSTAVGRHSLQRAA